MKNKRILSIKEAAEYLSLSESYIRDMIASKKFPFINISRGEKPIFRFDSIELDKWIEAMPGMTTEQLI